MKPFDKLRTSNKTMKHLNNEVISVSAPGKLMLLGEHAVVYGYPCIVSSVNKYITVTAKSIYQKTDSIITDGHKDLSFVKKTLEVFRERYSVRSTFSLTIKSELGNFGLGTSAAVTVATFAALVQLFGRQISRNELFDLCYKIVLSIQGVASGFDVASCIYGATIYFDGKRKVAQVVSDKKLPLVVGFSGKKVETVPMMEKVAQLKKQNPKLVEDIFTEVAALVEKGKKAIEEHNWSRLGDLMDKNQVLLEKLEVSSEALSRLISLCKEKGAWGVKLSGAGGGDCIIAIGSEEKRTTIQQVINQTGGQVISLDVGIGRGVI